MGYMGDVFYATEVASPDGAAVLTADELQSVALYATEVTSPRFVGASTLVVDRHIDTVFYANEFVSPKREYYLSGRR